MMDCMALTDLEGWKVWSEGYMSLMIRSCSLQVDSMPFPFCYHFRVRESSDIVSALTLTICLSTAWNKQSKIDPRLPVLFLDVRPAVYTSGPGSLLTRSD
jgi:hypothetical protein